MNKDVLKELKALNEKVDKQGKLLELIARKLKVREPGTRIIKTMDHSENQASQNTRSAES